jgi:hypothetical protein
MHIHKICQSLQLVVNGRVRVQGVVDEGNESTASFQGGVAARGVLNTGMRL